MAALERISLSFDRLRFDGLSAGPKSGELILHGFPKFAHWWKAARTGSWKKLQPRWGAVAVPGC